MKEKKRNVTIKNISFVFSLLFALLIGSYPVIAGMDGLAANRDKYSNYEEIRDIVSSSGIARIIVKLDVPGIEELTAESQRYRMNKSQHGDSAGGINADIALKEGISATAYSVLNRLNGSQYRLNYIYSTMPFMALEVSENALAIMASLPEVTHIERDKLIKLADPIENEKKTKKITPTRDELSRPMLADSVGLIGADNAWNMGYTGSGWYVAVLDTGIRSSHEFFSGKDIVEACFSRGEDGVGPEGDCPNGETSMTGPGSAAHHPDSYQNYDHGTHVTGIATGNNGTLFGVARDANIIAIQVFSRITDCNDGMSGDQPCVGSWEADIAAGLEYVYQISGTYNIAAVNISIYDNQRHYSSCDEGGTNRKVMRYVIRYLKHVNVPTVICTGNNGYCDAVSSPACMSNAVTVGASTDDDTRLNASNWHESMQSLFAPGHHIYSATGDSDNSYGNETGTSMAAPHVAGAWALMKQAMPLGTVPDFLTALSDTGVGITTPCDSHTLSIPRIQVDAAIQSLVGTGTITVTSPNGGEGWKLDSTQNITWNTTGISNNINILLWKDGSYIGPVKLNIDPGLGSYAWKVGKLGSGTYVAPGTGYKIRIRESSGAMVYDDSDAPFSIGNIEVTAPIGGEEWTIGSNQTITWNAEGISNYLKIVLWNNGNYIGPIKTNLDPGLGSYTWEAGKLGDGTIVAPGAGYKIRIREQAGSLIFEDSGAFSLVAPPIEQTAYPDGIPWPVPGSIEAENYDIGGEGIAYHDTTPGNICNPPRYRFEDVDIQNCYDTGGGYNVGWIENGEWLEYTVNVTQAGSYDFEIRAAAPNGGMIRLDFFTPSSSIPNLLAYREILPTGGAQEWKTITIPRLQLVQGEQVIRIYAEEGGFNLNRIDINTSHQTPYGFYPWTIPGRIEAENYDVGGEGISYHDTTPGNICYYKAHRFDDVDVEDSPLSENIINVGYIDVDEWLEYTVNIPQGGYYVIFVRGAAPTGGAAKIEIDGIEIWEVIFPASNMGPQDYSTIGSLPVYLPEGKQVIKVKMLQSSWNFDYIHFNLRASE